MKATISKNEKEINIVSHNEKMLKSALAYAKLFNWHVLPIHSLNNGQCTCGNSKCRQIAKHPITHNGLKSATNNLELIQNWWGRQYPGANIGIRTGKISDIFVLDVDIHKVDGNETLKALEKKHSILPDTVQSITGSGGCHYLFSYQEGIRNKVNFQPGLDIRGDGGYILAPPSIHETGCHYEWELSSRPVDVEVTPAPHWLIEMIKEPIHSIDGRAAAKTSSHWQKLMQGLAEGEGRNIAATSLTGYLLRRYVDPLLVQDIIYLWNERNSPPLEITELDMIINSVAGMELRRREGK